MKNFKFNWNTIGDLKGLEIGGDATTNYSKEFMEAEKNGKIKVQRTDDKFLNFKKLLHGRIKIYPMIKEAGYKILKSHYNSKKAEMFTHHPKILQIATWHLILTKEVEANKRFLKIFNQGLKRLKKKVDYKKLFKQ